MALELRYICCKSTFKLWLEGQAGRRVQGGGSRLQQYIASYAAETAKKFILWSGSRGGHNRNIKTVLLVKCALETSTHLKNLEL